MHTYGASRSLVANSTPLWGQRAGESARRDRRGFSSNSLSARNELKGDYPYYPWSYMTMPRMFSPSRIAW